METHKVYVYGTLRPGNTEVVKVPGALYDLGWFPGIDMEPEDPESFTLAEVVEVDDNQLDHFDYYEGYRKGDIENSFFVRRPYADGWIYVFNGSFEGRPVIEDGDWLDYQKRRTQ